MTSRVQAREKLQQAITNLDPATTTREEQTKRMLAYPVDPMMASSYRTTLLRLKSLFKLLVYYPGMDQNCNQLCTQSAASVNKIFYTWEFAGHTLRAFHTLNAKTDVRMEQSLQVQEVKVRLLTAQKLILSDGNGMVEEATKAQYGLEELDDAIFGEEIKRAARALGDFKRWL